MTTYYWIKKKKVKKHILINIFRYVMCLFNIYLHSQNLTLKLNFYIIKKIGLFYNFYYIPYWLV